MNVYTEAHLTPEKWMAEASCATANPDAWFPAHNDQPTAKRAKRICATCPVIADCLEYALRTKQREGIWAGYSPRSLERLRKKRGMAA